MPSSSEHRDKADQNRSCLSLLQTAATPQLDWIAVVAFYMAMHLIERLAACENLHHSNHQDRLVYVRQHKRHKTVYTNFSVLYDASQTARYGTVRQFENAYPGDTVATKIVGTHLAAIENYVANHFSTPAPRSSGS